MAMLDQIGQDKQRVSERLMRLDAERTKLSNQLKELEIAERALTRFGGNGKVVALRILISIAFAAAGLPFAAHPTRSSAQDRRALRDGRLGDRIAPPIAKREV